MSEADTVPTEERLPWLGEEAAPQRDHRTRDAIGLAIVAALLIFGVSYWIASQSWQRARERAENEAVAPPAAVPLPKAPSATQARPHRVAKAGPTTTPRTQAHPKQQVAAKAPTTAAVVKAVAENNEPASAAPAKAAEKQVASAAASSKPRVVRIGAFASPTEAKLGWRSMVRAYPALAHLPATVVDASSPGSKATYRFEIGTASQTHSELLCQRMTRIALSCAAVTR